jgi:hypothetical protein
MAFADSLQEERLREAIEAQNRKWEPTVICGKREPLPAGVLKDGRYVGQEPIAFLTGRDPGPAGSEWFHEAALTIADGRVTDYESPIVYVRGQRHESASEGGFYFFQGCLAVDGNQYTANMTLKMSEYGGQSKVESTKTLSIKPLGADIAVNGKRYRRRAKSTGK